MSRLTVWKRYFRKQLLLGREELEHETYEEVKQGAILKGHNFWIMFFAMLIACIGLNTDSISAVIGAMLISPLMGPVVGFAFGLALNDNYLKKLGTRNWLWMTLICLFASTFYFLVSPFTKNTTELELFKSASIFDIMLAFFGGMAGFIGIIKKEGSKIIAGVAVATACMPPLCTAGYGLATGNWAFLYGGLYFYFINCLFIGQGTFLLAKISGYNRDKNNVITPLNNFLWGLLITIILIPAVYIGYKKWKEERIKQMILTDGQRILELEKKVYQLDSMLRKN